jgi:hypothetical protein
VDLCRHCSCGDSEPLNETGESANKNRATRIVFAVALSARDGMAVSSSTLSTPQSNYS